jgi:cell division inhibitor SepF
MSVMRKAMVYLGLVDDEEFYADDDVYYAEGDGAVEEEQRVPARAGTRRESSGGSGSSIDPAGPVTVIRGPRREEPTPAPAPRATSVVTAVPMPATRVHVMEPQGFNDAQEVGDRLKAGQPVILNLQAVDRDLQRRLIDFSSGLAYALNGTMSKAAEQVFLLTPSNVEVSEEEKERLQARGLYRAART